MRPLRALLSLSLALVMLCCVTATASAQTVAGLQIDYNQEVNAPLQDALDEELLDIFNDSRHYAWMPPDEGIDRLDDSLRGCFDVDCLQQIGEQLGARIGLAIQFEADSQIYTWSVDFYDLATGSSLAREEGTCELCGRSEVVDQFRASVQGNLVLLDVDADHQAGPIETTTDVAEGLTQVRITTVPSDTRIFLDDDPVGEGEVLLDLEPGTYEVRFSHDTHHGLIEQIIIAEDSAPLFILRVHLRRAHGEQRMVVTRGSGAIDHIEAHRNTIGWSSVGAGAVLVVGSFFLGGLHGQPACGRNVEARRCPDVYNTANLATMTTIIGTTALAGGVGLLTWPLLAGDQQEPEPVAGVDLSPSVGIDFAGFSLSGHF